MNTKKFTENLIHDLTIQKFWGEVTIRFADGIPTVMLKQEQIKLHNNLEVSSRNNHRDFHDPKGIGHGTSINITDK